MSKQNSFVSKSMTPISGDAPAPTPDIWDGEYYRAYADYTDAAFWMYDSAQGNPGCIYIDISELAIGAQILIIMVTNDLYARNAQYTELTENFPLANPGSGYHEVVDISDTFIEGTLNSDVTLASTYTITKVASANTLIVFFGTDGDGEVEKVEVI